MIPAVWSNRIIEIFKRKTTLMGCDIHLWLEKRQSDGSWKMVEAFSGDHLEVDRETGEYINAEGYSWQYIHEKYPLTRNRNYERFAKLSGVRGEGPEPNGWPDNIDPRLQVCRADGDLHSHTHYSVRKAAKIFLDTEYVTGRLMTFARATPEVVYFGVDSTENLDDYRVLIAYDN